jgi:AcrR family transcriptional regulator
MVGELLATNNSRDSIAEQVVWAALAEFTAFGFRRVSMANVTTRTGPHRATVHHRFATNEDLVVTVTFARAR